MRSDFVWVLAFRLSAFGESVTGITVGLNFNIFELHDREMIFSNFENMQGLNN